MHPEDNMMHQLMKLVGTMKKQGDAQLAARDLTVSQMHTLVYLKMQEKQEAPLKVIEKNLAIAQSTSLGIVSRLEKKGFVETYQDEFDKRVKIVRLTNEGDLAMNGLRETMDKVEDEALSPLTDIEKTLFKDLLTKITG